MSFSISLIDSDYLASQAPLNTSDITVDHFSHGHGIETGKEGLVFFVGILYQTGGNDIDADVVLDFQADRFDKAVYRPVDQCGTCGARHGILPEDSGCECKRTSRVDEVLAYSHEVYLAHQLAPYSMIEIFFRQVVEVTAEACAGDLADIESLRPQGMRIDKIGGLAARRPAIAALFALSALSLAGLPPFSGFVAKLALVDAGIAEVATPIVVVSLVASVFTLLSMSKIWLGVFWGESDGTDRVSERSTAHASDRGHRLMMTATTVAVVGTLAIALGSGQLWDLSERAATDLVDPAVYIAEVLG